MKFLTAIALLGLATPAFAGADLEVTLVEPAGVQVGDWATWEVQVANVGNRTAKNYRVVIDLPQTNTSPTVHVLGDVGALDSDCYLDGTQISCLTGRIRKNRSKSYAFDLALPYSADALTLTAYITSPDDDPSNDVDEVDATLAPYAVSIAGPVVVDMSHCTGQDLSSYFECELYPSSLSAHQVTFEANGDITFVQPGYTGSWSQPTGDSLVFEYVHPTYGPVAQFEGVGVDGGCFEGVTSFPLNPTYNSPYLVCPQ